MSSLNALKIRRRLVRDEWQPPREFGPDGWMFDHKFQTQRVIASVAEFDGIEWIHASISHATRDPEYDDLKHLHQAVFADRYAFQVFAPPSEHINIHAHALHLWGRLDGASPLPDFGRFGTI